MWVGILVLGWWREGGVKLLFSTLTACYFMNSFSLSLLFFLLYYVNNSHVHMQMLALVTRGQCRVSDTQVTIMAHGPLV